MMTRRSGMATAAHEITAHDRDTGPLGDAHGRLPIDDQDLALPTARAVAPPATIASRVAGPMVGMSNRKSWPAATALTTMAPGPPRLVPRRMVSSVPSAASTASVTPRDRTTLWPIPWA